MYMNFRKIRRDTFVSMFLLTSLLFARQTRANAAESTPHVIYLTSETDRIKEVSGPAGHCILPCQIDMKPGMQSLSYHSTEKIYTTEVEIPASEANIVFRDPREKLNVLAGVLIPTGAVIGSSMWLLMFTCNRENSGGITPISCIRTHTTLWPVLGSTLLLTGIGLLIAKTRMKPMPFVERRKIEITRLPTELTLVRGYHSDIQPALVFSFE